MTVTVWIKILRFTTHRHGQSLPSDEAGKGTVGNVELAAHRDQVHLDCIMYKGDMQ